MGSLFRHWEGRCAGMGSLSGIGRADVLAWVACSGIGRADVLAWEACSGIGRADVLAWVACQAFGGQMCWHG